MYDREETPRPLNPSVVLGEAERGPLADQRHFQTNLLDAVGQAVIATTLDGRITYWNRSAETLYGWSEDEALGRNVADITPSDMTQAQAEEIMTCLRAGEPWSGEFMVRRRDGTGFPALVTETPIHDDKGTLSGIIRVSADISAWRGAQDALRRSEERYRLLVETSPDAIVVSDMDATITFANRSAARMYRYDDPSEMVGLSGFDLIAPVDRELAAANMAATIADGRGSGIVHRVLRRDGSVFSVEVARTILRGDTGEPIGIVTISRDITARLEAEEAIRAANQRARTILESITDGFFTLDLGGRFTYVNARAEAFLQRTRADLLGKNLAEGFPEAWGTVFREEISRAAETGAPTEFEANYRPLNSWFEVHVYPSDEGLSIYFRDVSERRAYQDQLQHQALHDSLTELPNRTLFEDRVQQALRTAHREKRLFSILLADLNHFKEVNDTLGHRAGDELLTTVGKRFQATLRESDTVARFGGDEFVFLLANTDAAGATHAAEKLLAAVQEPLTIGDHTAYVGASVGVAMYPEDGEDAQTLIRHADVAMYTAKRAGSGYALYHHEEDPYSTERLALIAGLRRAIDEDQLVLHYQPKIALGTGWITGVEGLIRWQHPERGMIPPGEFVPLAEHTGLIRPMTVWVLNEALRQHKAWQDDGIGLRVCVNISMWSLRDVEIVETIQRLLHHWDVEPRWLKLEVTESALMTDPPRSMALLMRLAEMGLTIAIDDFGTGYSSLGYLDQLAAHELKIDRSFVRDLVTHEGHQRIVQGTVSLGHDLGLQVIAEGVENGETAVLLAEYGCDMAQGYHIGRPMGADDLAVWYHMYVAARQPAVPPNPAIVVIEDDPALIEMMQDVLEGEGFAVIPLVNANGLGTLPPDLSPILFLLDVMLRGTSGLDVAEELARGPYREVPMIAMSASERMRELAEESSRFVTTLAKPFDIQALLNLVTQYADVSPARMQ